MSPHHGWLPPSTPQAFWPSEPPAGLGPWGRQTEHRLEVIEAQTAQMQHVITEISDLQQRLGEIEDKPEPAAEKATPAPQPSPAGLLANPNLMMLVYLAIGLLATLATGRIPDLSGIVK